MKNFIKKLDDWFRKIHGFPTQEQMSKMNVEQLKEVGKKVDNQIESVQNLFQFLLTIFIFFEVVMGISAFWQHQPNAYFSFIIAMWMGLVLFMDTSHYKRVKRLNEDLDVWIERTMDSQKARLELLKMFEKVMSKAKPKRGRGRPRKIR